MEEIDMEGLSRKQRKLLKKKLRKEEEKKTRQRGKRRKLIVQAGIVIVVLLFIGLYFMSSKPSPDSAGSPLMRISTEKYSFGDVSVSGGIVSTEIDIENLGDGNLMISRLESSCMCTTATIIKDGVEGPVFGMHENPAALGWSQTVGPNETAQLKIYYDPTVHRELRGPVTRIISIHSNDPASPRKEVRIDLNQV